MAASALLAFSTVAFAFDQAARAETSRAETSQGQLSDADKTSYAEALAYCRGNVPRPMALRLDRRVLCFDGMIENPIDPLTVYNLAQGGLFVVRSAGGEIRTTMQLANLLLDKRATVIVNGYCLANCANYLSIASVVTFVPKDSVLAWRNVIETGECAGFSETGDAGAPHFGVGPCPSEFHDGRRNEYIEQLRYNFYSIRARRFRRPPESITIRRILKRKFDETGTYPQDVSWTWNPRLYSTYVRTKIFYEAYPRSQDEVDTIAARVGLREKILYDP